jgi:hypothetical protein
MSQKQNQRGQKPAEETKPAAPPRVEQEKATAPTETTTRVVSEAAPAPPAPPTPPAETENLDSHGNVACEALQGVMHLGQFLPPGSKFSLDRQLFRRMKKLGHVKGARQD